MRADRLLSILLLLQTRGRMSARELAEQLEVSERTIHRDMESLSMAGVPVVAERGASGGWSLMESYRTNLTGLKPSEIQSLFVTPARLLDDLGLGQAAEVALLKLLAALPDLYRRDAEFARQHIYVDGAGWRDAREHIPCLPILQEAIWAGRKLAMTYQRTDGAAVERMVDPLGLVARGTVWYLVAAVDGEPRTYRVSRVSEAHLCLDACTYPEGFDLATFWEQSKMDFKAQLPRYPATLRVHPDAVMWLYTLGYSKVERLEPADADGWQVAHMLFEVLDHAAQSVLGLGGLVAVIEPPELRDKVIEGAQAVLERYANSDDKT